MHREHEGHETRHGRDVVESVRKLGRPDLEQVRIVGNRFLEVVHASLVSGSQVLALRRHVRSYTKQARRIDYQPGLDGALRGVTEPCDSHCKTPGVVCLGSLGSPSQGGAHVLAGGVVT